MSSMGNNIHINLSNIEFFIISLRSNLDLLITQINAKICFNNERQLKSYKEIIQNYDFNNMC